jgi:hypothetical protein
VPVLNACRRVGGLIFHAQPHGNVRWLQLTSSGRAERVPR